MRRRRRASRRRVFRLARRATKARLCGGARRRRTRGSGSIRRTRQVGAGVVHGARIVARSRAGAIVVAVCNDDSRPTAPRSPRPVQWPSSKELPAMKPSLYALLASVALAAAAHAHTPLASSTPADKASVAAPVKEIALSSAPTCGSPPSRSPTRPARRRPSATSRPPSRRSSPSRSATSSRPGDYVATWRAVGADTHVISGEIHFTVTAPHSH